jgi:magnesium-transporting ATPase (P-type)
LVAYAATAAAAAAARGCGRTHTDPTSHAAQIDHVFSDKTGTLTQNLMKIKHWYIRGRIYDEDDAGTFGRLAQASQGSLWAADVSGAVDSTAAAAGADRAKTRNRPRRRTTFSPSCVLLQCATPSSRLSTKKPRVRQWTSEKSRANVALA